MRKCKVCGKYKEINEYNIQSKYNGKKYFCALCKECDNERRKRLYYKLHEEEKERRREYYKLNSEKWPKHQELTKEQKEQKIVRQRERRKADRRKNKAYKLVAQAIKNKILFVPAKCSLCSGKGKIVAHHHDYDFPLDVVWLCEKCHMQLHSIEKRRRNAKCPANI